jgi:hypothetical protein
VYHISRDTSTKVRDIQAFHILKRRFTEGGISSFERRFTRYSRSLSTGSAMMIGLVAISISKLSDTLLRERGIPHEIMLAFRWSVTRPDVLPS